MKNEESIYSLINEVLIVDSGFLLQPGRVQTLPRKNGERKNLYPQQEMALVGIT